MRISQRTGYIIGGGMVLFAVLPSSWYVSCFHVFWPPGSSGASRADSEGDLWRQLINQGAADLKLDQYEEAESHFRDALELADRLYSKTHHRRLQSLQLLSMALLDQDKSSEAVTVLDEEVDIKAATLPEHDVSLLESMGILASTLYQAGDAVRAASTAQRLIGIAEAHGNPVCEPVTHALMTLSKCDLDSGNIMAAGEHYRRVLDIEKQLYGEISVPVVLAEFYLAGIAVSQRNNQEVDRQIEKCKNIITALPRPLDREDVEMLSAFMLGLNTIGLAAHAAEIRQLLESLDPGVFAKDG